MKISIDVIGEMRNTVKTFADRYCFIDELVQNAERASASEVRLVECSAERIVIANDGKRLDDFSVLFTKSISGWAAQGNSKAAEIAFGAGFFSVMVVADMVVVRSGSRGARWDIARMLEYGQTEVVEEFAPAEYVYGFEVELTRLKDVDVKRVRERWEEATRYFGVKGRKKRFAGLFEGKDTRFCKRIDIPGVCEGAIWVQEYGNVETWYENRRVDSSGHAGSGIGGKFFITGLSPRAPDRKEWIRDAAFNEWVAVLIGEGNKLLEKVVAEGSDELIDSLGWPIRCRVGDLREKLRFVTLEEYQMEERSRKIQIEKQEEQEEATIYRLAADAGLSVVRRDVEIKSNELPSNRPSVVRRGKRLSELRGTIAWIRVGDIDENAAAIQELRENGVTVVVARNDMQAEALRDLDQVGVTRNILRRGATLSRRGALNEFEDGLCGLLRGLSNKLGCVAIELCDINGWTENKAGGRRKGQNFLGLYYREGDDEIVAVGRSALKEFDFTSGSAVKALAYVSDVVAEEVAHSRGYVDGDVLLEREKVQVMRAILDIIVDGGSNE